MLQKKILSYNHNTSYCYINNDEPLIENFNIGGAINKGIKVAKKGVDVVKDKLGDLDFTKIIKDIKNAAKDATKTLKKELGENLLKQTINKLKKGIQDDLVKPIENITKFIDVNKIKNDFTEQLIKVTNLIVNALKTFLELIKDGLEKLVNDVLVKLLPLLFFPFITMILVNVLFIII
jgi:hypothetical protein